MANQVILAVAGSGKTYHICHSVNMQEKNLILAFTHENLRNIRRELIDANGGRFPELTNVMTFDSFLYGYIVQPYEPSILSHFNRSDFKSEGITMSPPPQIQIKRNGRSFPNPHYFKKGTFGHYISPKGFYYCETLAELIMTIKKGKDSLIKRVSKKMREFYDRILVDEFQDFRESDYDLICEMAKFSNNVTLVGDFYQHSVSGKKNTGTPFKKGKHEISYEMFLNELRRKKFIIDEQSLTKSRRCAKEICVFIQQKLGISIESQEINHGTINWVDESQIEEILNNKNITKLIYNDSSKYSFPAINWTYSKGDTMDETCVILTGPFEKIDQDNFNFFGIEQSKINRLYVALSRTKGNLHLVKKSTFDKVKELYKAT